MKRALGVLAVLGACVLPAEERVSLDRAVGRAEAGALAVEVRDGLAAVRSFDDARLELWAQAPTLHLNIQAPPGERRPYRLDVYNCMQGAVLRLGDQRVEGVPFEGRMASCRFDITLESGSLEIGPPDADVPLPFVFAVLSDVQRAIDRVDEVFARMNEDTELAFVVSTGDLVNTGTLAELERFQHELATLDIPFFSTVGNHEMGGPPRHWHHLFGPFNVHFSYKGAVFSLVDSANATVDPEVYAWLDGWLEEAKQRPHTVLTHFPPLDPVGLRGGAFRSRKEGAKFLQKLGAGQVDALFLGHIHSYYAFSGAGVPAYISGGGGAIEERFDGISRHYLRVRVDPERGIESVGLVRVD